VYFTVKETTDPEVFDPHAAHNPTAVPGADLAAGTNETKPEGTSTERGPTPI
jgi:hypothetical protein